MITISLAALLIGLLAAGTSGALTFWLTTKFLHRSKHVHVWYWANATPYDSITGPRTIVTHRCKECGKGECWTQRGDWTLAQLRGDQ